MACTVAGQTEWWTIMCRRSRRIKIYNITKLKVLRRIHDIVEILMECVPGSVEGDQKMSLAALEIYHKKREKDLF